MFNWDVFGAGMAMILIAGMFWLFSGTIITFANKVLGVKTKSTIPSWIYWGLFIVGIVFILMSAGLFTSVRVDLTKLFETANVPELVMGVGIAIAMGYGSIREKIQRNLNIGFAGTAVLFVFGLLLILDALAIFPIFSGLSFLFQSVTNKIIAFIKVYPGFGLLALLGIAIIAIVGLYFVFRYVSRRAGG